MITEEEYLRAKAIVDQYEQDEFEEGMRIAEEALDFDYEEREEKMREMEYEACHCGSINDRGIRIADCIC